MPATLEKLDASVPQRVSYCIPTWLRDLQIEANIKRARIGRIEAYQELRSESVAIVCFGPSLVDTWDKIRDFKFIVSCSGAHKFLIERGIVPTWHVEVDPREHKIKLIGQPHADVEYLIASACHPKLLDHLSGFNVKLWHIFDPKEEIPVLPRGEWMITGGCGAGLRAMTIARFLGFREQHIFGMDGCEGATGKHAAEHPSQARDSLPVDYAGKTYYTTPAFLEAARSTFHELDELKDVVPTFYGEGLVQAMAKNYKPKVSPDHHLIAFNRPELISAELRELNARLHQDKASFGMGGDKYADLVKRLRASTNSESVLDYGCGKGNLARNLPFPIWEYDPAVSGKEHLPRPADLVICTDVLEHVEQDKIGPVIDDLARCTKRLAYIVIHTGPARKTYADGRNTHLIQQGAKWWRERLEKMFSVAKVQEHGSELHIIAGPKQSHVKVPDEFDKHSHKLVLEDWVKINGWRRGAEIGVYKGETFFHLLKRFPELTLYGVDIWESQPAQDKFYDQGGRSYKFDELPGHYTRIAKRAAKEFPGRGLVLKGLSVEMAAQVADGSLDFVFIDGDHLEEGVRADIKAWKPKVRYGGVVSGHDIHMPGVASAVMDLCPGFEKFKQNVWGMLCH